MFEVIKSGLETSIQDYPGRIGSLNQGFPISGPMDNWSFRLANLLVGNEVGEASLECQYTGPTLKFLKDRIIAITGANMNPKIDGTPAPMWENIYIKANQILEMEFATIGARAYISFSGGIQTDQWLNSRSTFHKAGVGGVNGKAIQKGQKIPLGDNKIIEHRKIKRNLIPIISTNKEWEIEVVKGPNDDWVDDKGHKKFLNSKWKLQAKSDRTGYRLDGPKWTFTKKATQKGLEHGAEPSNIIDQGYPLGGINLAGQTPIILVNDGPSMGGFINPYTVPTVGLWKLGQAKPGDFFYFKEISIEKAQDLRIKQNELCSNFSIEKKSLNKKMMKSNQINTIKEIKIRDFDKEKNDERKKLKIKNKNKYEKMKVRFY